MSKIIVGVIFILMINSMSFAQFSVSSKVSSFFNDNLYRSPDKTGDWITNVGIILDYQASKYPVNLEVNPDYYFYASHPEQNFWFPSMSAEYFPFLDKNKNWQFYSSIDASFKLNKDDLKAYNYWQVLFSGGLYHDGSFALQQISYQYQLREYPDFSELSNRTHFFNWKLNKSFKTRTTLITNVQFSSRQYESQTAYIVVTDTLEGTGSRGRGRRESPPRIITHEVLLSSGPVELQQLAVAVRIAQNVWPNFGVFVQYLKSFNLSSTGEFQNYGAYWGDEQLFDDPLSYLRDQWSAQLTWMMPQQWQLRFSTVFNRKSYIKEKAYLNAEESTPGGELRKDQKLDFTLTLGKSFFVKEKFTTNIRGQAYYTNNNSNSYWYNYQNLISGISINLVY